MNLEDPKFLFEFENSKKNQFFDLNLRFWYRIKFLKKKEISTTKPNFEIWVKNQSKFQTNSEVPLETPNLIGNLNIKLEETRKLKFWWNI